MSCAPITLASLPKERVRPEPLCRTLRLGGVPYERANSGRAGRWDASTLPADYV